MNTLERCLLAVAASTALITPAFSQNAERRATISGGGRNDSGKCTIEVYVDGSADVEIRGDRGSLRTVSGQPAQWRRFECSAPMPANPSDFRFSGVDGRGRQELIQDPRRGGGAAVVRIQDTDGGAEGYTFDLVWSGLGSDPRPTAQPYDNRDHGVSMNDATRACQDAVREKASQQFGAREVDFQNLNAGNNPGRNDSITGSFDVRRGSSRDTYRFSCTVANGRIRGVEISPAQGNSPAERHDNRADANSECQRAATQRIMRDGYQNVQAVRWNSDNRRNDRIVGTARAQRGDGGPLSDFDISCSVSPDNGNVRLLQANRR